MLYGTGLESPDLETQDRIWLKLRNDTHIGLEKVAPGGSPRIARFGIKVTAFDSVPAVDRLRQMGAEVLTDSSTEGLIRFKDKHGITLEVIAS